MTRFTDTLANARNLQNQKESIEPTEQAEIIEATSDNSPDEFWAELETKEKKKAVIKLSVSVPLALDAKIKAQADKYGISKNELINKMLEHMLK